MDSCVFLFCNFHFILFLKLRFFVETFYFCICFKRSFSRLFWLSVACGTDVLVQHQVRPRSSSAMLLWSGSPSWHLWSSLAVPLVLPSGEDSACLGCLVWLGQELRGCGVGSPRAVDGGGGGPADGLPYLPGTRLGRGSWVPGLWLERDVRNVFHPCLLLVLSCRLLRGPSSEMYSR